VVSIRWLIFLSACTATILSWTDSVSAQQRWVEVVALPDGGLAACRDRPSRQKARHVTHECERGDCGAYRPPRSLPGAPWMSRSSGAQWW
jgi:hypothetical protein